MLNSYSSVLHYNHFDYRAMLEGKKKADKKSHESTLMRQIVYFLIFFILPPKKGILKQSSAEVPEPKEQRLFAVDQRGAEAV